MEIRRRLSLESPLQFLRNVGKRLTGARAAPLTRKRTTVGSIQETEFNNNLDHRVRCIVCPNDSTWYLPVARSHRILSVLVTDGSWRLKNATAPDPKSIQGMKELVGVLSLETWPDG